MKGRRASRSAPKNRFPALRFSIFRAGLALTPERRACRFAPPGRRIPASSCPVPSQRPHFRPKMFFCPRTCVFPASSACSSCHLARKRLRRGAYALPGRTTRHIPAHDAEEREALFYFCVGPQQKKKNGPLQRKTDFRKENVTLPKFRERHVKYALPAVKTFRVPLPPCRISGIETFRPPAPFRMTENNNTSSCYGAALLPFTEDS